MKVKEVANDIKDKIQEILNSIVDGNLEIVKLIFAENENEEPLNNELTESIQQVLNCRLSKKELEVLIVCMIYYLLRHNDTKLNGIELDYKGDLFNKLRKQLELLRGNEK
ncbi:MAG: hypothetical protein PHC62_03975 [Candidatus Izemoplasmatales bacterium]|nr:hypothetical protein [Candidatus Izemoplasmatales bacterium]